VAAGIRFLSGVVEIVGAERQSLSPLFTDPRPLSPGIDMVLENLGAQPLLMTRPRRALLCSRWPATPTSAVTHLPMALAS